MATQTKQQRIEELESTLKQRDIALATQIGRANRASKRVSELELTIAALTQLCRDHSLIVAPHHSSLRGEAFEARKARIMELTIVHGTGRVRMVGDQIQIRRESGEWINDA